MKVSKLIINKPKQNKKWYTDILKEVIEDIMKKDYPGRIDMKTKIKLQNLDASKHDKAAIRKRLDIFETNTKNIKPEHYPILPIQTNVLLGELAKRPFLYTVEIHTSDEETVRKAETMGLYDEVLAQSKELSEAQLVSELYKVRELHIKTPNELKLHTILSKLLSYSNFNSVSEYFFRSSLVIGEEIAMIDDSITIRPITNSIYVNSSGILRRASDLNGVVHVKYMNVPDILVKYGKELNKNDIDKLKNIDSDTTEDFLNMGYSGLHIDSHSPNIADRVRVIDVKFKSILELKLLKYYDNGVVAYKHVYNDYVVDKNKGEEFKKVYIPQWHTATMIYDDIYVDCKPIKSKFISTNGTIKLFNDYALMFATNDYGEITSMYSMAARFSELYDIIWHLIEDLMKRNFGKVMIYDVATEPTGYNFKTIMEMMRRYKMKVIDSRGNATESYRLGQYPTPSNTTGGAVDMDLTTNIRFYMEMLNFIEGKIMRIVGFNEQRLGNVSASELVTNVQRAITQSALSTESKFRMHYDFMTDLMVLILHKAKYTDNDVLNRVGLTKDEIQFMKDDFGENVTIKISNEARDFDISNSIDEMVKQAYMQNPELLPYAVRILNARSYVEKLDVIKQMESNMQAKQEQQSASQQEMIAQQVQMEFERKIQEHLQKTDIDINAYREKQMIDFNNDIIELEDKFKSEVALLEKDWDNKHKMQDTINRFNLLIEEMKLKKYEKYATKINK